MEVGFLISAILIALLTVGVEIKYSKDQNSSLSISTALFFIHTKLANYFDLEEGIALLCVLILAMGLIISVIVHHKMIEYRVKYEGSEEEIIKTFDLDNNRYLVILKFVWIINFIHLITLMYEGDDKLRNIFIIIISIGVLHNVIKSEKKYFYTLFLLDIGMIFYIVYFVAPTGELAPLAYSIQLILAHMPFFFTNTLNDKINNKMFNFSKKKRSDKI